MRNYNLIFFFFFFRGRQQYKKERERRKKLGLAESGNITAAATEFVLGRKKRVCP